MLFKQLQNYIYGQIKSCSIRKIIKNDITINSFGYIIIILFYPGVVCSYIIWSDNHNRSCALIQYIIRELDCLICNQPTCSYVNWNFAL